MTRLRLTLYVAGQNPRSTRAVLNLRKLCDELAEEQIELDVVDVVEDPRAAEEARILATPTLVKEHPPPRRRVTGDLSDPEQILVALALDPDALRRPQAPEEE